MTALIENGWVRVARLGTNASADGDGYEIENPGRTSVCLGRGAAAAGASGRDGVGSRGAVNRAAAGRCEGIRPVVRL